MSLIRKHVAVLQAWACLALVATAAVVRLMRISSDFWLSFSFTISLSMIVLQELLFTFFPLQHEIDTSLQTGESER